MLKTRIRIQVWSPNLGSFHAAVHTGFGVEVEGQQPLSNSVWGEGHRPEVGGRVGRHPSLQAQRTLVRALALSLSIDDRLGRYPLSEPQRDGEAVRCLLSVW